MNRRFNGMGKPIELIGVYKRHNGKHMLLRDVVTTDGRPFRDHMWLPYTKRFRRLKLRPDQTVHFKGKLAQYRKRDGTWQLKVQNIGQMRVI